jgi:hypothetical protein
VVDGVAVGVTPWTGELPAGFHRFTVELASYQIEERTFDLPPTRSIDVPVTLTAKPPEAPAAAPVLVAPPFAKPACRGMCLGAIEPITWITLGVGAASLVGAVGFELNRSAEEDKAEQEVVQREAARRYDKAFQSQKWATALAVTGGALVVTGGVLAILDIHDAKNPDTAWNFGCAPDGCAVGFSQTF